MRDIGVMLFGLTTTLTSVGCQQASAQSDASAGPIILHSVQAASIEAPLPEFDLVDQKGRHLHRADLQGKVWVTDFFFTTCTSVCPKLTKTMSSLAGDLTEADVRFVSVTVDPENDTPEKLDAYASKYGADSSRWLFLTGEPEAVQRTILRGFRMALSKSGDGEIFHTERFVVVDKKGVVRGVFDATPEGLDPLKRRVRELLAE